MKKFVALAMLLAGCGEKVKVNVNCVTTNESAVECTVQQTEGTTEVNACWDFTVTCPNGNLVKAPRMCQKIGGGRTEKAIATADKLTGLDKCGGDGKPTAALSNMSIDDKPVEQ